MSVKMSLIVMGKVGRKVGGKVRGRVGRNQDKRLAGGLVERLAENRRKIIDLSQMRLCSGISSFKFSGEGLLVSLMRRLTDSLCSALRLVYPLAVSMKSGGKASIIRSSLAMRLRWIFRGLDADRQVSCGLAVI